MDHSTIGSIDEQHVEKQQHFSVNCRIVLAGGIKLQHQYGHALNIIFPFNGQASVDRIRRTAASFLAAEHVDVGCIEPRQRPCNVAKLWFFHRLKERTAARMG